MGGWLQRDGVCGLSGDQSCPGGMWQQQGPWGHRGQTGFGVHRQLSSEFSQALEYVYVPHLLRAVSARQAWIEF